MVKIEGNKLIIELEANDPVELLYAIQKGIVTCVQSVHEVESFCGNEELSPGLYYLLELHNAMLPTEEELRRAYNKESL